MSAEATGFLRGVTFAFKSTWRQPARFWFAAAFAILFSTLSCVTTWVATNELLEDKATGQLVSGIRGIRSVVNPVPVKLDDLGSTIRFMAQKMGANKGPKPAGLHVSATADLRSGRAAVDAAAADDLPSDPASLPYHPILGIPTDQWLRGFYNHNLKGTANIWPIMLQLLTAGAFLWLCLIGLLLQGDEHAGIANLGKVRAIENYWFAKFPFVLLAILCLAISAAYAPIYQPIITFSALGAIVLAFEHFGGLNGASQNIQRLERDLGQRTQDLQGALKQVNVRVDELNNRLGLADWHEQLCRQVYDGSPLRGSVMFWDIDAAIVAFYKRSVKAKVPRPHGRFPDFMKSAATSRTKGPHSRNLAAIYLHWASSPHRAKQTFILPLPSSSKYPLEETRFPARQNFVGCCYQQLIFEYANTLNEGTQNDAAEPRHFIYSYIASDCPWCYIVGTSHTRKVESEAAASSAADGRDKVEDDDNSSHIEGGKGYVCQLAAFGGTRSGDFALDLTAASDGNTPFEVPKEPGPGRQRILLTYDSLMRRFSLRLAPIETYLNNYFLYQCGDKVDEGTSLVKNGRLANELWQQMKSHLDPSGGRVNEAWSGWEMAPDDEDDFACWILGEYLIAQRKVAKEKVPRYDVSKDGVTAIDLVVRNL